MENPLRPLLAKSYDTFHTIRKIVSNFKRELFAAKNHFGRRSGQLPNATRDHVGRAMSKSASGFGLFAVTLGEGKEVNAPVADQAA